MQFIKWFLENIYSNCFTIVTVIVSGLISWIISAIYYHMGNRISLKISVILPVLELLQDNYTKDNYNSLCKISREYSVKYLRKDENRILTELRLAYKDIYSYDEDSVNANILFSYFEDKLKENDIELEPIPVYFNDEIVDYEPPQGMFELIDDLEKQLNIVDPKYQPEDCQEAVEILFGKYCRQYYSSKDIVFFDDLCLEKVLAQSELHAKWNQKFIIMKEAKERFQNLRVTRELFADNQLLLKEKTRGNHIKVTNR